MMPLINASGVRAVPRQPPQACVGNLTSYRRVRNNLARTQDLAQQLQVLLKALQIVVPGTTDQ
jgi:hypothetical protein